MKGLKEARILAASNCLFLRNGYNKTTMRQIAEEAGVSLGLATYHFKNKRALAVSVVETYCLFLWGRVDRLADPYREPLVNSAATIHLSVEFFCRPRFRSFYLECLAADIYAECIHNIGRRTLLQSAEGIEGDYQADLSLMYDNYLPPCVEKTLLLEKERGRFAGIPYEDVAGLAFAVSQERYVSQSEIEKAAHAGREIAKKALEAIPDGVAERLFALPDFQ